uniref:TPR_REGION domain-containing protein n=1 Tax=Parastrongyloides trichosuri TaxID=131310 RepID=A0A0N4ZNU8_PARTI
MNNNKKQSKGINIINNDNINYLNTLINNASIAFGKNEYDNALKLYNEAILIDHENHVLYSNKSAILLKLGKAKEALQEADYSINLQPTWPKAYFRKGEALKSIGRFSDAIIVFSKGLSIDPDCDEMLEVLIQTGILYPQISKSFINVLESMKKLNLESSSFVVISVLGQEMLSISRPIEAIQLLNIALNIDGGESIKMKESIYGALAKAYYDIKNFIMACDCMEKQIDLNKLLGDTLSLIELLKKHSKLSLKCHDIKRSIDSMNKALALEKDVGVNFKKSLVILAELYKKCEDWKNLENITGIMLSEMGEDSEVYWILGKMFIQLEQWEKAEDCLCYGMQFMRSNIEKILCECYILKCKILKGLSLCFIDVSLNNEFKKIDEKVYSNTNVELCEIYNILFESAFLVKNIKLCKLYVKLQTKFALEYQSQSKYHLIIALGNLSKLYLLVNDLDAAGKTNEKRMELVFEDNRDNRSSNKGRNECDEVVESCVKLEVLCTSEYILKCLNQKDRSEERFKLLEDILVISKNEGEIKCIVKYLIKLIKFCKRYGKDDKIYGYLEELKNIVNSYKKYQWMLFKIEGHIFGIEKNYVEAVKKYTECLMIVQEDENLKGEIKLCRKLALAYEGCNEYEEALIYLEQGLTVSKQCQNIKEMFYLYRKIGEINQALRRYSEALEAFKRYLTLAEIFSEKTEIMTGLIFLSEIYISLKEYNVALNILIEAKNKIYEKYVDREKAIVYGLLGKVYLFINKKKNAMSCFCKQMCLLNHVNNYQDMLKCLDFMIFEKKQNNDVNWCVKLIKMRRSLAKKVNLISEINVLKEDSKILFDIEKFEEAKEWLEEGIVKGLSINYDFDSIVEMILNIVEINQMLNENDKALKFLDSITKIDAFSDYPPVMIIKGEIINDLEIKKEMYKKIIENGVWNESIVWEMVQLNWDDTDNERWIDEYSTFFSTDNSSLIKVLKLLKEFKKNIVPDRIEEILRMKLCDRALNLLYEGFLHLNIYAYLKKCMIKLPVPMNIYYKMNGENWKGAEVLIQSLKLSPCPYILESLIINTFSTNEKNLPVSLELISNVINQSYLSKSIKNQLKCHDKKEYNSILNISFVKEVRENYYYFNSGLWNKDGKWYNEMIIIWKILEQQKHKDCSMIDLLILCEICQRNSVVQYETIKKTIESKINNMDNFIYLFNTSFIKIFFIKNRGNEEIEVRFDENGGDYENVNNRHSPIFYKNILFKYLKEEMGNERLLKWDNGCYDCSNFINYPVKGNVKNYTDILIKYNNHFDNRSINIIWIGKEDKIGVFFNEPSKSINNIRKIINNTMDLFIDTDVIDISIINNIRYLNMLLIKTKSSVPNYFIKKSITTIIFDNDVEEEEIVKIYKDRRIPSYLFNKVYIYGDITSNFKDSLSFDLTDKFRKVIENPNELSKLLKETTIEPRIKLNELIKSFDIQNKYRKKNRRRKKDCENQQLHSNRNSYIHDNNDGESGSKNYWSEGEDRKSVLSNTFSQMSMCFGDKELDEIEGESGARIMSIEMEYDYQYKDCNVLYDTPRD